MDGERAQASRARSRTPMLMRGESVVASVGIALAAILIAAVLACGYWLVHTQRAAFQTARLQQVQTVGDLLTPSVERLLDAGELTAARRLLMDAADRSMLSRCRVVLPSGDVIADADPARITAGLEQANWTAADAPSNVAPSLAVQDDVMALSYPVRVVGRGSARLEIVASLAPPHPGMWEAQAGVGIVGIAALLALLLVYRHFRARLLAMGVIREALLAIRRGETAGSALAVAGDLGAEAAVWNELLAEQQTLRQQAVVEKARESFGVLTGAGSSGTDPSGGPPGRTADAANGISEGNPASLRGNGGDLRSGCDAVSHGLLLVDDRLRVRYANHAAGVFLQISRDAMLQRPLGELLDAPRLVETIAQAARGQLRRRVTDELERGEAGAVGVLRFSIHPVRRGESAAAMVVIEDVTQQRVAEQSRHQFVAQATHELRTPLTNIRLYLETAQDVGEKDAAQLARCLNIIAEETHRLERLVGDMLSVAEIEAGSLEIRHDDVRLDALLRDVEASYQAQAAEKQIALTFKLPPKLPVVQGDRDKLSLAVQNLVGNALKYTPQGGQVTVNVEADDGGSGGSSGGGSGGGSGPEITIEVTDSGIGIGPEDTERIFEKFYRAQDKRLSGITGSGLGLALAREVVRLHGGDITVQSQIDKGSTFTLTLPKG